MAFVCKISSRYLVFFVGSSVGACGAGLVVVFFVGKRKVGLPALRSFAKSVAAILSGSVGLVHMGRIGCHLRIGLALKALGLLRIRLQSKFP